MGIAGLRGPGCAKPAPSAQESGVKSEGLLGYEGRGARRLLRATEQIHGLLRAVERIAMDSQGGGGEGAGYYYF